MTWSCSLESAVIRLTLERLQESYSYRHNLVLHCVVSNLSSVFAGSQTNKTIHVYAGLLGMHASVSPQVTIPPTLLVIFYRPDIVIYNESTNSIALLDLTCTLYSIYHLESARDCKQTKEDYLLVLSKLDKSSSHYLQSSLSSLYSAFSFIQATLLSRSQCSRFLTIIHFYL